MQESKSPGALASDVMTALTRYIADHILDGKDIGLDATTPLLEWGVINSLEIVRIITFVSDRFGVAIPSDKVVADHFKDLQSLTNLVVQLVA